jgi:hypothetical protein
LVNGAEFLPTKQLLVSFELAGCGGVLWGQLEGKRSICGVIRQCENERRCTIPQTKARMRRVHRRVVELVSSIQRHHTRPGPKSVLL